MGRLLLGKEIRDFGRNNVATQLTSARRSLRELQQSASARRKLYHQSVLRKIELQLLAQAADFRANPTKLSRSVVSHQRAVALYLPTEQRFLHYLQSEYGSRT